MPKLRRASPPDTSAAYHAYTNSDLRELHRGRGASGNPANRFEALYVELDPAKPAEDDERPRLATQFYRDATKTIIARNNSPDVGFEPA